MLTTIPLALLATLTVAAGGKFTFDAVRYHREHTAAWRTLDALVADNERSLADQLTQLAALPWDGRR